MSDGATNEQLDAVEAALGVSLPATHRDLLGRADGTDGWHGMVFLTVYGTEDLVAVNREITGHPGFLAIASDGSQEQIGLDTRATPAPVVLIDPAATDWSGALKLADDLDEFLDQRGRGEELRRDQPYAPAG